MKRGRESQRRFLLLFMGDRGNKGDKGCKGGKGFFYANFTN